MEPLVIKIIIFRPFIVRLILRKSILAQYLHEVNYYFNQFVFLYLFSLMFKYIKFLVVGISIWLIFSCNEKTQKPLIITFSADSSQIVVKDINEAGLFQLKNKLNTDLAYQKLVTVLQTPADDDSTSMEMEWEGELSLKGDELIYTPKISFVKGNTYLIETILNAQFASGEDVIKDRVGIQIRPQQQILKR